MSHKGFAFVALHRHDMRNQYITPAIATGNQSEIGDITDKRGYARRWQGSLRWVDGLLAQGLPHLKIGKRRVRIVCSEADFWMKERFGTRRLGSANQTERSTV